MLSRLRAIFNRHKSSSAHNPADQRFVFTIIILVAVGLVMLTSASSIVAYKIYGDSYYFLTHQLVSVVLGAIAFWLFSKIDYRHWRKIAFFLLLCSLALLSLVFVPGLGREVNGSQSWINFFGFSLQPSEIVKLTFIIYLAALFENKNDTPQRFKSFLLVYGVVALLMLLQPDPGTLFILTAAAFGVYYIGGGKRRHIVMLVSAGLLALLILVIIPQGRYRLDRFRCLFDASYSPQQACYQVNQSLIAIGSGGLFGRGLGESRQKFLYLPEVQNDFIFAVIAEEVGFVFSVALIGLFAFLFYRMYIIAVTAPDTFSRNLTVGIALWLITQVILNIGGIIRILPLTGVPLPLISYGGSAILSVLGGLGIVAGISKQRGARQVMKPLKRSYEK